MGSPWKPPAQSTKSRLGNKKTVLFNKKENSFTSLARVSWNPPPPNNAQNGAKVRNPSPPLAPSPDDFFALRLVPVDLLLEVLQPRGHHEDQRGAKGQGDVLGAADEPRAARFAETSRGRRPREKRTPWTQYMARKLYIDLWLGIDPCVVHAFWCREGLQTLKT